LGEDREENVDRARFYRRRARRQPPISKQIVETPEFESLVECSSRAHRLAYGGRRLILLLNDQVLHRRFAGIGKLMP
jgi:hypothetical protein